MASSKSYDDDAYVSVGVAAEIAGVHPNTLRRWQNSGSIPLYRTPGNLRRFRVGDLRNLVRLVPRAELIPPGERKQAS